mgnify:CR=1 FL=1
MLWRFVGMKGARPRPPQLPRLVSDAARLPPACVVLCAAPTLHNFLAVASTAPETLSVAAPAPLPRDKEPSPGSSSTSTGSSACVSASRGHCAAQALAGDGLSDFKYCRSAAARFRPRSQGAVHPTSALPTCARAAACITKCSVVAANFALFKWKNGHASPADAQIEL